jgi:hypothetical protein
LFAFAIAVCCVASSPIAEFDDGSKEMGSIAYSDNSDVEVVSGLVGNIAQDIEPSLVHKGPKVNGGFALNINPLNVGEKRVANADCAGHIVDGKCVRLFPKRSRTATIDDNMLSPEQLTTNLYETDIHQMVKTHFNQNVMEETNIDDHHVGMPGYEVIETEMNKEGNSHANTVSDTLFPIGSTMMRAGDSERSVDLSGLMNQGISHDPVVQAQPTDASPTPSTPSAPPQHVTVIHNSEANNDEEVGDLEEIVPQAEVDAEPGLPPTPTPSPTPDPELIRQAQLAAEQHAREVAACVTVLEKEGLVCAASNEDLEQAVAPMVHVQVEAPKVEAPVQPPFDVSDVKGNFQKLISNCVNKVTQDFTTQTAQDDSHLIQKRLRFSQSLVKFASALSCVDSEDFPACMPSEASQIIQQAPVNGQWNCF